MIRDVKYSKQAVILLVLLTTQATYSSDVSAGMPRGISVSLALLHLTMVPVHEHLGGQ